MKINFRELVMQATAGVQLSQQLAGLISLGSEMPWEIVKSQQIEASCSENGFRISEGVLNEQPNTRAFIGLHEVGHHGFRHVQRSRAICRLYHNVCMLDCNYIGDVLLNELIALLTSWGIPEWACCLGNHGLVKEGFEVDMTQTLEENAKRLSEHRIKQAKQKQKQQKQEQQSQGKSGDEQGQQGSSQRAEQTDPAEQKSPNAGKKASKDDSISDAEMDRLINQAKDEAKDKQAKEDAEQMAGGRGDGAGKKNGANAMVDKVINEVLGVRPKIDWRQFLKGTLKGLGSGKASTFARASRRQHSSVVLAGRGDASPSKVLFAIDKSSSMAQEHCDTSRAVIADFLKLNAGVEVWVAEFNSQLEEFYKATPRRLAERVIPTGGTRFERVVDAYNKMAGKPSKVFVLTDCEGKVEAVDEMDWGKDTVWLFYEKHAFNNDRYLHRGNRRGRDGDIYQPAPSLSGKHRYITKITNGTVVPIS